MISHGLTDVVVCPGSRNAAIVNDLAEAGLRCHPVTDERSAGFFAIGLAHALARPVAVCVTSGSAVLDLAPAVSEAYYQRVPILLITADRPDRWIGQMDGQTLPQPGAFGSLVAKSVSLPEPSWDDSDAQNKEVAWHANRLVNEAIIAMCSESRPVQINVPISEPLFDFSRPSLPDERVISLSSSLFGEHAGLQLHSFSRILLVVGQLHPAEAREVARLLSNIDTPVLAESLSNISLSAIGNFESILAGGNLSDLAPDLVITLGGHIVSKPLKRFIREVRPAHWHVSPDAEVADLFMCLTHVFRADACSFLGEMSGVACPEYSAAWRMRSLTSAPVPDSPDLAALRQLVPLVTESWHVHVANSSMVRNVQKLWDPSHPFFSAPLFCNRGVNGIEGSVSEAVGYWASGCGPTLVLVGDLSFFYDQNALWNSAVKLATPHSHPLRIFIVNNGCGEIFHHLPGLSASSVSESFVAASHATTAEGIAQQNGCAYRAVRALSELRQALPHFLDVSQGGVGVLEYFC